MNIDTKKCKKWIRKNKSRFVNDGNVDFTGIAEGLAKEFNLYADKNREIPEEVFELIVKEVGC